MMQKHVLRLISTGGQLEYVCIVWHLSRGKGHPSAGRQSHDFYIMRPEAQDLRSGYPEVRGSTSL